MPTKSNHTLLTDSDTNTVFFSNWLPKECPNLYKNLNQILNDNSVDCRLLKNTKDIWCRDFMPIQTEDNRFVSYKYLPNYLNDAKNRKYITNVKKVGDIDLLKWGDNVVELKNENNNIHIPDNFIIFAANKPFGKIWILLILNVLFQETKTVCLNSKRPQASWSRECRHCAHF